MSADPIASSNHTAQQEPLLTSSDGVERTTAPESTDKIYSPAEALEARVIITKDYPVFPKPLFYTLLAGVFAVHIPAIVFSTPFVQSAYPNLFNGAAYHVLSRIVWVSLLLPGEMWTAVVCPVIVVAACLIRKDGGKLWRYQEVLTKPLELSPAMIRALVRMLHQKQRESGAVTNGVDDNEKEVDEKKTE